MWNELLQNKTMTDKIKKKRLIWLRHVTRMALDRLPIREMHRYTKGRKVKEATQRDG